jgi:hypothetical protein
MMGSFLNEFRAAFTITFRMARNIYSNCFCKIIFNFKVRKTAFDGRYINKVEIEGNKYKNMEQATGTGAVLYYMSCDPDASVSITNEEYESVTMLKIV